MGKKSVAKATLPEGVTLKGSATLPAEIHLNHGTVQLDAIVQRAFADSGLSADAWNDLPDEQRELRLNAALEVVKAEEEPPAPPESKAAKRVRVVCKLENASESINGISFVRAKSGMVSEEIDLAVAQRLASIPGFEILSR